MIPVLTNPFELFQTWYMSARKHEIVDPNAMCLSTCGADTQPSSRMVLMKELTVGSLIFYTNLESRKALHIEDNEKVSLNFHWKSIARQVRFEGKVRLVDPSQADAYFASRPRGAKIGAWASQQSRALADMGQLKAMVAAAEERFEGVADIPRPDYWSGYEMVPHRVEFWAEAPSRLHERLLYLKEGGRWVTRRLYP